MSYYTISFDESAQADPDYVQLTNHMFECLALMAYDYDNIKGIENFYLRCVNNSQYYGLKNLTWNNTLTENICYFDTTQIQDSIDFLEDELIPHLYNLNKNSTIKIYGSRENIINKVDQNYRDNKWFLFLSDRPDDYLGDLDFEPEVLARYLEIIVKIFKESIRLNIPYKIYKK